MKVLVTGATGFIGTTLCKRLEEEGHDVYRMSRYVASQDRYDFYQKDKHPTGDIRNGDWVDSEIDRIQPDVVIHLAAMSSVSYSFQSLATRQEVAEVIYGGTINVAEACVKHKIPRLIHASTSEFYGYQEEFPILENAIPHPESPYAVSKVAAEEYIRYLERTYGLPFVIIRPYNTYNRSQVNKRYFVVERAITGALLEGCVHLYTPLPVRDLLDRDSHVDAYMKALESSDIEGQAINIGYGEGNTIGTMAEFVARMVTYKTGREIRVKFDQEPDRPYDIKTLICSNEKAYDFLGWKPLMSLEEGLGLAVEEWAQVLGVDIS